MKGRVALLAVAMALSGCASRPPDRAVISSEKLVPTLESHRWTLVSATDSQNRRIEPLATDEGRAMSFIFVNNRLNITGGCNSLFGGFRVTGEQLEVSRTASTMMACAAKLMETDIVLARLLLKPLRIEIDDGAVPRMQLVSATNDTLVLTGNPTLESRYGPPTIIFLEVASQEVACKHPVRGDMRCLQVRERKYDANGLRVGTPGAWRPLFESIDGFAHVEGQRNVVRVKVYQRPPMARGAADNVYVLDLIVESEIVAK